jgi:hypothetical protein
MWHASDFPRYPHSRRCHDRRQAAAPYGFVIAFVAGMIAAAIAI